VIVGYAAAIWGCVGLRQWIVVFSPSAPAISPLIPRKPGSFWGRRGDQFSRRWISSDQPHSEAQPDKIPLRANLIFSKQGAENSPRAGPAA
jgi:hypothetical protein